MAKTNTSQSGSRRRVPLRTNDQIHDAYGLAIGKAVLAGEAPFQNPTTMPPPETPGVPAYAFVTPDGVERQTRAVPARTYGPAKAQFLRAYARERGIVNPQFVSRRKAVALLRANGEDGHLQPAMAGARYIEVPRNRSARNMAVVLIEDGPNFDADGNPTEGRKGDRRLDANGKPVFRPVEYGPLADEPPVDIETAGDQWDRFRLGSRPNRILPLVESNATAAAIARPGDEAAAAAVEKALERAGNVWDIEVRRDEETRTPGVVLQENGGGAVRPVVLVGTRDSDDGAGWDTAVIVALAQAYGYLQGERDPEARPDALTALRNDGPAAAVEAALAREAMVANMAAQEFLTAHGLEFRPVGKERTEHLRGAQARALATRGGYRQVTYNAARALRMLAGLEPTVREEMRREREDELGADDGTMTEVERAAAGIPFADDAAGAAA